MSGNDATRYSSGSETRTGKAHVELSGVRIMYGRRSGAFSSAAARRGRVGPSDGRHAKLPLRGLLPGSKAYLPRERAPRCGQTSPTITKGTRGDVGGIGGGGKENERHKKSTPHTQTKRRRASSPFRATGKGKSC